MSTDSQQSMTHTTSVNSVIEGLIHLRKAMELNDSSLASPTVPYLLGAINATSESSHRGLLLSLLASEYGFLDLEENEIHARKAAIDECPLDPDPRIAMSGFYYVRQEFDKSIGEARIAVSQADASGRSRRNALQTLARSLRKAKLFVELEETLRRLIELKGNQDDSRIETDFLIDLPEGAVSSELVDEYRRLRGK
jgi:hypothetical protein